MQVNIIENEISKLNPVNLETISGLRLMNRIETKYLFTTRKLADLIRLLGLHYQVLEISNTRMLPYSTTYLDTADSIFYYQHVRGELDRYKIRYRRYDTTSESFLEIKRRTNKGRTIKWRIHSEPCPGSFDSLASGFIEDYLPVSSALLKPALETHFTRLTFAGFEFRERITIDFNISFSSPEKGTALSLPYLAIAELKKEAQADSSNFKTLLKQVNIYPAGFSKYCIGCALINDSLKKNTLKPKLLLLNKLKNGYTSSDIT